MMMRDRANLVKAVLARLEARSQFHSVAREIAEGLTDASRGTGDMEQLVGELDPGLFCGNPFARFDCANDAKGDSTFHCLDHFDTFACKQPLFGRCGGDVDIFDCEKDFDCGAEVYNCWMFECTDGGFGCGDAKEGKHGCEEWDFMCGGLSFSCDKDFDCEANHIFRCFVAFNCIDDFDCSAGPCPDPHLCPAQYARDDDGAKDTEPGDFACGGRGTDEDYFTCTTEFTCRAADEFDCSGQLAEFNCGDNEGVDDFDCHATFECDSLKYPFQCIGDFECDVSAGKYVCGDSHACSSAFTCSEFYECDGVYICSGTFDCVYGGGETSFLCDSSFLCSGTFDCVPENLFLCEQPVKYGC